MLKKVAEAFVLFGMAAVLIFSATCVTSASPLAVGCGLPRDLNNDGKVDITDILLVASCWRSTDSEDIDLYDLDVDGDIDIHDIMLVAAEWGNECPLSGPLAPFGVQMFGEINDADARAEATEAGIGWVRLITSWASSNIDGMVQNAINAGLEPIIVLGYSPSWAVEDTGYDCGPIDPDDLPAFANSVQALVERYDGDGVDDAPGSPVVKYWEFWNEPDNESTSLDCIFVGGCWGKAEDGGLDHDDIPDPQEYVTMLSYAYPKVKAANPDAQVLLGALAWENQGCFNMNFLDQVLSYGGAQYFDITNFHQYDFKRDDWDGALPCNQGILGKIAAAKGKVDKPIVVSEIGLRRELGEEKQARHLVHEVVRGMSLWPNDVKSMIYYLLVDEASNPTGHFGLLERGTLDPFPAYYAYQTLTEELGEVDASQPAVQLGPDETGSEYIQAYRFTMLDGGKKLVLWTDDGQRIKWASDLHINMAIDETRLGESWAGTLRLRVVDSTSGYPPQVTIIEDGGSGDLDGSGSNNSITLEITQDPVYVEASP
jgi:hypothetical protein